MGMTLFGVVVGGFNLVVLRDRGDFVRVGGEGEGEGYDGVEGQGKGRGKGKRDEDGYVFDVRRRWWRDRIWDAIEVFLGVRGIGWWVLFFSSVSFLSLDPWVATNHDHVLPIFSVMFCEPKHEWFHYDYVTDITA